MVYQPSLFGIVNIYIYIWVNFITTSLVSRALEIIVRLWEIIPFWRKIQVSEILFHLPRGYSK